MTVVIEYDSLGYYWQHPETGQWFGPYNVSRERLLREIAMAYIATFGIP